MDEWIETPLLAALRAWILALMGRSEPGRVYEQGCFWGGEDNDDR